MLDKYASYCVEISAPYECCLTGKLGEALPQPFTFLKPHNRANSTGCLTGKLGEALAQPFIFLKPHTRADFTGCLTGKLGEETGRSIGTTVYLFKST